MVQRRSEEVEDPQKKLRERVALVYLSFLSSIFFYPVTREFNRYVVMSQIFWLLRIAVAFK